MIFSRIYEKKESMHYFQRKSSVKKIDFYRILGVFLPNLEIQLLSNPFSLSFLNHKMGIF